MSYTWSVRRRVDHGLKKIYELRDRGEVVYEVNEAGVEDCSWSEREIIKVNCDVAVSEGRRKIVIDVEGRDLEIVVLFVKSVPLEADSNVIEMKVLTLREACEATFELESLEFFEFNCLTLEKRLRNESSFCHR